MNLIQAFILGLAQGITELLPISSSAHLVLIPEIFGWDQQPTSFDIAIHAATLLALVIYFQKDLFSLITKFKLQSTKKLILNLIVVTIPAGLIGLFFNDLIEETFKSVRIIVVMMILVGIIFLISDKLFSKNSKKIKELSAGNSFLIGIFQALALIRGTSRSGITMIGGLVSKLTKEQAAKFSFLAGIFIMSAVSIKQFFDFGTEGFGELDPLNLVVASIAAFSSSILAIKFLMNYLKSKGLAIFGWYRIIIGIIILLTLI
jgi:undecaprenyl-diphosphatase